MAEIHTDGHDVIVVGTSAGGVTALQALLANMPAELPAAIFLVMHIAPTAKSALPQILARAGRLPVKHPVNGEKFRSGHVYVAPPDQHMLLDSGSVIRLSHGPKENHCRPAIDTLFRSAALHYGARVIGVVLTGNLDDGTSGLVAIKARGGISVVQSPADAQYGAMPTAALRGDSPDHNVPLKELPSLLEQLSRRPAADQALYPVPDLLELEMRFADFDRRDNTEGLMEGVAKPSSFVCPECNGTLFEVEENGRLRYRCRVGHAFSPKSMESVQTESLEGALWTAVRALEESASLARRIAIRAKADNRLRAAAAYEARATEQSANAQKVRSVIGRATKQADSDEES